MRSFDQCYDEQAWIKPIRTEVCNLQDVSGAHQRFTPRKSSAASASTVTTIGDFIDLDGHRRASKESSCTPETNTEWSDADDFSRASSRTPDGTTDSEVPKSGFGDEKAKYRDSAHEEMMNQWSKSMADDDTCKRFALMLSKLKIFGDASLQFLELLARKLQPREYKEGEEVMKQGDHGDWLCIVLKGSCFVNVRMAGQTFPQRLGELRPGKCCGELAMLGILHERMATVTAAQPTVMLVLSKDNLEQVFRDVPSETVKWEHILGRPLHVDKTNLKELKFFSELTPEFVEKIQEQMQTKLFYRGDWLMKEGEYGSEMYILRRGTVGIFQGKVNGHNKHVVDLSDNAVIGEMAVLAADKRAASVLCKSLCVIQVLQGDVFKRILADYPEDQSKFDTHSLKRLVGLSRDAVLGDLKELNRKYGRVHPNREILIEQHECLSVVRAPKIIQHNQMPAGTNEGCTPKPRLAQIAYMALR
eukprot:gnl/MRDRNA2_/MRDRNA2_117346_c0_seq1.p1 gnl/MRDRNA2_/MRDRNA2_117346_c0~~gnl/MRDRNA2_/MRDRNA2_117346_c0_seq1.p1  ORF type:complete len:474 (+),score=97.99 gnl/MRDRNA2_/MRDRNA2_117346_c0_seq1:73-1494(+)